MAAYRKRIVEDKVRWDVTVSLDADLSVAGLAHGIFGTRTWMSELARAAGSRTSAAKAAAARQNGRLGGRPKKSVAKRARSRSNPGSRRAKA